MLEETNSHGIFFIPLILLIIAQNQLHLQFWRYSKDPVCPAHDGPANNNNNNINNHINNNNNQHQHPHHHPHPVITPEWADVRYER